MPSNEHTGARLVSKPPTQEYQEGFKRIFGNRPPRRVVFGENEQDKAEAFLKEQGTQFPEYQFTLSYDSEFGSLVIYSNKIE